MSLLHREPRPSGPPGGFDDGGTAAYTFFLGICVFLLVAALSARQVTAAIKLSHAATVGAWVSGLHWTLGTYVLYLLLYVLTWQVARKLAWLQRIHWHQRSPLDPASPVAAKA